MSKEKETNTEEKKPNIDEILDEDDALCSKTGKVCKETEYLELAQRIKAEFENYKKRNAEISVQSYTNGIVAVISKLLPALDGFQKAKEIIKDENVLNGVGIIFNQIQNVLKDFDVTQIEAVGKPFDPNFHNAVLTSADPNYPNETVLEELQSGFMIGDKVVRYSVVRVNRL